jgi:hypothetical protein
MLLTERVSTGSKPQVDRDTGIIRGVKILGERSVNGRRYSRDVRERARTKYEGRKANIDHPGRNEPVDRSFRDWVGTIENVQVQSDGTYADLRLRKKHAEYESILEAAEHFWKDFGMSHVAECDSKRIGGCDEVIEIVEVFSVDIVGAPATVANLYESIDVDGRGVMPGGGMSDLAFDELMQELVAIHDRLGSLQDATAENLRRLTSGGTDANRTDGVDEDGFPTGRSAYQIISTIDVEFARGSISKFLNWYRDLPLASDRKQSADVAATTSQLAAIDDKIAKAEGKNAALESRYARKSDDTSEAQRIFEARRAKNQSLREAQQKPASQASRHDRLAEHERRQSKMNGSHLNRCHRR